MRVCTIIWTEDDVRLTVKQLNRVNRTKIVLTDKEVETVLESMEETHDGTIGVTWATIDFWIELTIGKRGMN